MLSVPKSVRKAAVVPCCTDKQRAMLESAKDNRWAVGQFRRNVSRKLGTCAQNRGQLMGGEDIAYKSISRFCLNDIRHMNMECYVIWNVDKSSLGW